MLAVKNRRASDYVAVPVAARGAVVVALAAADLGAVASPARALQAELAARLAGETAVETGRSLRMRAAMIVGAALLCWVPIAGAVALIFA